MHIRTAHSNSSEKLHVKTQKCTPHYLFTIDKYLNFIPVHIKPPHQRATLSESYTHFTPYKKNNLQTFFNPQSKSQETIYCENNWRSGQTIQNRRVCCRAFHTFRHFRAFKSISGDRIYSHVLFMVIFHVWFEKLIHFEHRITKRGKALLLLSLISTEKQKLNR